MIIKIQLIVISSYLGQHELTLHLTFVLTIKRKLFLFLSDLKIIYLLPKFYNFKKEQ
jgi:hypothetical protein